MNKEYWNEASSPEPCVGMVVIVPMLDNAEATLIGTATNGDLVVELSDATHTYGNIMVVKRNQIMSRKAQELSEKEQAMIETANKLVQQHSTIRAKCGATSPQMADFWLDLAREIEGCK